MLRCSILFMGLAIGTAACGGTAESTTSNPSAASARAEGLTRQPMRVVTEQGRDLGFIDGIQANLDRVELDVDANHGRAVASVVDGWDGSSRLVLVEGGGRARELVRLSAGQRASRPSWAPNGGRFAVVVQTAPVWTEERGERLLSYRGALWLGGLDGSLQRLSAVPDAARVLGWVDGRTLLVTRHIPGDLPEERPLLVDVLDGRTTELLEPSDARHYYGLTWQSGRLLGGRTTARVVTVPAPWQRAELVNIDVDGRGTTAIADELGALPSAIELQNGRVRYVREGAGDAREVDLSTGQSRAFARDAFVLPSPGPMRTLAALQMPYVHQVYDTTDSFNGHWACGPTSTLMAICHFGKLDPWPMTASTPTPHESPFGSYVSEVYTAYGTTFDRMQTDASGQAAHGAYGWCTEDGAAWAWRMQDYAEAHELSTEFDDAATFSELQAALDAGKAVALSTQLTSAGHIITVKGTTANGELVVNDPYGNWNTGYMNYDGEGAVYAFGDVAAKWFITVYATGPQYKAVLVSADAPATMVSGTTATASLKFRNEGTLQWDDQTLLGTVEPRDRVSDFHTPGEWLSDHRVMGAPAVTSPGAEATYAFTLTAPAVCEPTTYTENFNLVLEGVAWFSDSGQGGPADGTVTLTITVTPEPGACEDGGGADGGGDAGDGGNEAANVDSAPPQDSPSSETGEQDGAGSGSAATSAADPELDACACGMVGGRGTSLGTWGTPGLLAAMWVLRRKRRRRA